MTIRRLSPFNSDGNEERGVHKSLHGVQAANQTRVYISTTTNAKGPEYMQKFASKNRS